VWRRPRTISAAARPASVPVPQLVPSSAASSDVQSNCGDHRRWRSPAWWRPREPSGLSVTVPAGCQYRANIQLARTRAARPFPSANGWMRSQVAWWVATASIATLSKPGSSGRGRLRHRCVEAGEGALQAGLKRLEVLCRLRSELAVRDRRIAPLAARLAEVERRLSMDSSNSSTPPATRLDRGQGQADGGPAELAT